MSQSAPDASCTCNEQMCVENLRMSQMKTTPVDEPSNKERTKLTVGTRKGGNKFTGEPLARICGEDGLAAMHVIDLVRSLSTTKLTSAILSILSTIRHEWLTPCKRQTAPSRSNWCPRHLAGPQYHTEIAKFLFGMSRHDQVNETMENLP